jgi:hypothetical protein
MARKGIVKTDINIPAWLRSSWKASLNTGIKGGTFDWFNGAATLARNVTTRMTQA